MKVGYVQFAPEFGRIENNIELIRHLLSGMVTADLAVLPELCFTGYAFENREEALGLSEPVPGGITTNALIETARTLDMHIVAGVNERDGKNLYNSAVLAGPQGYVGTYRKTHLFDKEKLFFTPGDRGFPLFDVGGARVGVLVCFDWAFPEAWRTLALKGADIVCHPSNFVLKNYAHKAIPVHAIINRIFIVSANRVGLERNLEFIGGSMIVAPGGKVLHQASDHGEETRVAEIHPPDARDKMITARNDVFGDRRPDIYRI